MISLVVLGLWLLALSTASGAYKRNSLGGSMSEDSYSNIASRYHESKVRAVWYPSLCCYSADVPFYILHHSYCCACYSLVQSSTIKKIGMLFGCLSALDCSHGRCGAVEG